MENKIISINISPENDEDINENAGVMWEHNATSLVFNIDPSYAGDYRYYIEYRSLMGTKVRTEYLELDRKSNTITYDIPVTMTSLKGVECYFNIVKINDDGETEKVVKPKKFCLQFDYSPDTDNSLAKVNDFSINALLEAIRTGAFKGEPGEPIADVDSQLSKTSRNPVQNKVIFEALTGLVDDFGRVMSNFEESITRTTEELNDSMDELETSMLKYANEKYVYKENGKGLSTNDFTDEYKEKLDNVDENPATQITSISESTEYGGSSVITFNDGNTLTVKNGTKGVNGYTPVKGVDYYTESEKESFRSESIVMISEELAKRGQLKPEFANNTGECTDTSKLYVLPDGNIYAYMKKTIYPEIEIIEGGSGYWYWTGSGEALYEIDETRHKLTNYIPVTEGDSFRYKGVAVDTNTIIRASWYDENKAWIDFILAPQAEKESTITVPAGAKYVRFYSMRYTGDVSNVVLEVEWINCQSATSESWAKTGMKFVPADYEEEIQDHEERITDLEGKNVESILKGKKIVYDGDSLCSRWVDTSKGIDNGGAYPQIIADLTGCTFDNRAVGGARLVTAEGATNKEGNPVTLSHSIVDNLVNLPTDGDLYCFEGGVNDHWNGVPLGDFDERDYESTLDTKTMCGALEYIFRYAIEHFVGKPICFIIVNKCVWQNEINGQTFADYREKMIGICKKYAIPYYDAWGESGLNFWCQAHLDNYFVLNIGDHPNAEGYKKYYVPQLISLFERIMPR